MRPVSVPHSVGSNDITGDGAAQLAKVVLEHTSLTDFCSIPLVSLRENSITDLDLQSKGVGVPGAIVLSSLLTSATALKTLKYAAAHGARFPLLSAAADTRNAPALAVSKATIWLMRRAT